MHWVWLSTLCWSNICPQSMHDSCKSHQKRSGENNQRSNFWELKRRSWDWYWADGGNLTGVTDLVSRAHAKMVRELRLLQVLAAVLALKPHHFLQPLSLSLSLSLGFSIVRGRNRGLWGFSGSGLGPAQCIWAPLDQVAEEHSRLFLGLTFTAQFISYRA